MNVTIAHREVARSVRFQQHPTLTACWVWIGSIRSDGIGIACFNGRTYTARQAVYELLRGPADGSLHVRCGTALCVNPEHLRVAKR